MGTWPAVAAVGIAGVAALILNTARRDAASAAAARRVARRKVTWLVGLPVALLVVFMGLPFAYTRLLTANNPKPLTFADLRPTARGTGTAPPASSPLISFGSSTTSTNVAAQTPAVTAAQATAAVPAGKGTGGGPAATSPVAGAWSIGAGSEARYGVDDTALGQTARVVGSTNQVSGTMDIVNLTVTATTVVVNMQSVACHCIHDSKYRQIMETNKYPTSTFVLTTPITLGSVPAQDVVVTVPVTGDFTIHGTTHRVTFSLQATRISTRIAVKGTIPVKFSDYNIQAPNGGGLGGLSNCTMDLLLAFDRTG
jgi:polyisoprenoid-binding protein YceI